MAAKGKRGMKSVNVQGTSKNLQIRQLVSIPKGGFFYNVGLQLLYLFNKISQKM